VVATLALAQGMHRMARRNAVVKQLSAVETLGAANLIFTDKTGTLTENHMTVARLALMRGDVEVEHDDDPGFAVDHRRLHPSDAPDLRAALEIGALCNNASVEEDGAVGDPTEVSLLEAAVIAGIGRPDLLGTYPEVREIGFDPDLKMMATVHEADGDYRFAVKGAPEAVLGVCARVLTDDGSEALDDDARERWRERADALAADGLRVLALAEKTESAPEAEPYTELTLAALAGLYDPPRKGIAETVAAFRNAGIRVVMGTGDHAATAQAIAAEIGLAPRDEPAVEAAELDRLEELGDDERRKLLERRVFARISPEQKLRLIGLYQKEGRIVGMTGDGVNDAPALKKADIGIAMGKRGTEVAREAADVVLKDDALSTLVAAVEHGRTIFRNIRRFIVYLLSGNLGEIMAVSAAALAAAPLPLLPLQILYINFVSDVMPALALGLSPSRRSVMQEPPRDPREPILLRRHWVVITVYGALLAAAVLAAFALGLLVLGLDTAEAVTVGFLTFGFARLWHVLNMRGADSGLLVNEITLNPVVWLSIAIGVLLLFASVYLPLLAGLLSTQVPSADGWLLIAGFSLAPLFVVQAAKTVSGRWGASDR
jgi:Ca2+-transporting ATPase